MKEVIDFLRKLSINNNREWFNSHKEEYIRAKDITDTLAQKLILEVARFDPEASHLSVADCTYRIYRDTRFSPDKTPYKTHIGIFINPPYGKKSNRMGYYLHIEPDNCLLAAGTVCLPSKTITAIRQSIYDNIEEYLEIINNADFRRAFTEIGENCVKTAPKGFPRDWEHIALIRPRDFVATHYLAKNDIMSPKLAEIAGGIFKLAKPFNDFINYAIDERG